MHIVKLIMTKILCISPQYPTAAFVLVVTLLVKLVVDVMTGVAATLHSPLLSYAKKILLPLKNLK